MRYRCREARRDKRRVVVEDRTVDPALYTIPEELRETPTGATPGVSAKAEDTSGGENLGSQRRKTPYTIPEELRETPTGAPGVSEKAEDTSGGENVGSQRRKSVQMNTKHDVAHEESTTEVEREPAARWENYNPAWMKQEGFKGSRDAFDKGVS